MLNVFQEGRTSCLVARLLLIQLGRSHMAIVSRRSRRVEHDPEDVESVMTAAVGGLRHRFMRKVVEISHGGKSASDSSSSDTSATEGDEDDERKKKPNKKRTKQARKSNSDGSSPTATSQADRDETAKRMEEAETKRKGLTQAAKLIQLEQIVPADAQLPPDMVEKVISSSGLRHFADRRSVF